MKLKKMLFNSKLSGLGWRDEVRRLCRRMGFISKKLNKTVTKTGGGGGVGWGGIRQDRSVQDWTHSEWNDDKLAQDYKHKEIIKGAKEEGSEVYKRWNKLTNNQEARWVGSRQIDMRAHGTQKTKTKPCAHTKQKHKHMASKSNHQPCAKQDTNTQLMRILISH